MITNLWVAVLQINNNGELYKDSSMIIIRMKIICMIKKENLKSSLIYQIIDFIYSYCFNLFKINSIKINIFINCITY